MPRGERLLLSHENARWLPAGGRADVVLARQEVLPSPTCLVRVLGTCRGKVFVTERPDGRGLDLPTRLVGDDAPEHALDALVQTSFGRVSSTRLLGFVRNIVPEPPADYPWSAPTAHFVVWHCVVPSIVDPDGLWLDAADADAMLCDRHWWPLARHVSGPAT